MHFKLFETYGRKVVGTNPSIVYFVILNAKNRSVNFTRDFVLYTRPRLYTLYFPGIRCRRYILATDKQTFLTHPTQSSHDSIYLNLHCFVPHDVSSQVFNLIFDCDNFQTILSLSIFFLVTCIRPFFARSVH